ncbi:hypothetical protein [Thermococcus waiotapuensis]|uniref:Uncharacterized protein n=1 Tax=Thermococcus waiotapuensis TaxID=90909 RepID=A0AAE4NV38_9EURY|nr:hypothetical protein [Thermococcus waiotapuensis]MDV3103871.1 hypothetical protein [Thermococcus waiotapuensis]
MAKTTFEEEIYLRALTGRLVGKALADLGLNKVAVVASKNIICSSIATATEATFMTLSGGVTYHFLAEKGKEAEIAERVKAFAPQVTVLQFGGETPIEETKEVFVETLRQFAEKDVPGAFLVHVRIFAAGGLARALEDEKIREYLRKKDVFVYTVGFDEGKVYVNKVILDGNEIKLEKMAEYPVTLEHADLLNRSLRDRSVTFV